MFSSSGLTWKLILGCLLVVVCSWVGKSFLPQLPGVAEVSETKVASSEKKPSGQTSQRTLRLNLKTEPPTLDPVKMSDMASFSVMHLLMRGLLDFDASGKRIPAGAESWQISDGGKRYTFRLRHNAQWRDGSSVTAQQYVEGCFRALDSNNQSPYVFFLYPVKGAKAFFEGKLRSKKDVGIQALDAYTLEFELEKPLAYFLDLLTAPVYYPARLDLIAKDPKHWMETPEAPANGPYQLASWEHDRRIRLTPNPRYFRPVTGVDQVELLMIGDATTAVTLFEQGLLDLVEYSNSMPVYDVRRFAKHPRAQWLPLNAIYYLSFHTNKPPFHDKRVRKAFALAFDRTYLEKLLPSGSKAETSFLTPWVLGYSPSLGLKFNPKAAQKLLAEAGYPNGKGFPKVTYLFPNGYETKKEAEIAQYLWKTHLGVSVDVQPMDWKVYLETLRNNTPHLYKLSWYGDYPDPDTFMSLFTCHNENNYSHWCSLDYDQWVNEAAHLTDAAQRQARYTQAQKHLLEEEVALMPWTIGRKLWLTQPWVKQFTISASNLWDLDTVEVRKPERTSP
jgi:oligopeptide transport system substrate-binding protein